VQVEAAHDFHAPGLEGKTSVTRAEQVAHIRCRHRQALGSPARQQGIGIPHAGHDVDVGDLDIGADQPRGGAADDGPFVAASQVQLASEGRQLAAQCRVMARVVRSDHAAARSNIRTR